MLKKRGTAPTLFRDFFSTLLGCARMEFDEELAAVLAWVEETDDLARAHFRVDVPYETKADGTPVTHADRGIETVLRARIASAFPEDAVLGEEEGLIGSPQARRRWILDPIDGTKNFARGIPVYATLIALLEDDEPMLSVVSAPGLGARWWAVRGSGAFRDGEPIHVSSVARLEDADLCSGDPLFGEDSGAMDRLLRLAARMRRHRGFGDFWGHMLVAQGSMDAMVELAPLSIWDVAALHPIVTEAGGTITALDGTPGVRPGQTVSTNGRLHAAILADMA